MDVEATNVNVMETGIKEKKNDTFNLLNSDDNNNIQKQIHSLEIVENTNNTKRKRCNYNLLPYCCYVDWKEKKIRQREHCNICAIIIWIFVILAVAVIIFFLIAFNECIFLPIRFLKTNSNTNDGIFETIMSNQPTLVQNRSNHGIVKVLSYNVFLRFNFAKDDITAKEDDFKEERMDALIDRLDQYDILLLQEIWLTMSNNRLTRLINRAGEKGFKFYARGQCRGPAVTSMLLILSRHPLTLSSEHTFKHKTGDENGASKGVLHARALINDDANCPLDLFTTHMQSGSSKEKLLSAKEIRSLQVQEMSEFVLKEMDTTAIVTGDFNIDGRNPDSSPSIDYYNQIIENMKMLNNSNNKLSNLVGNDGPFEVTSPKRIQKKDSKLINIIETEGKCLDYAFFVEPKSPSATKSITSIKKAMIDSMPIENEKFNYISDHFAVVSELQCK